MLPRVGDPGLELGARGHGAGGVVWEAEVNDIGSLLGDLGNEAVLGGALEIDDAVVGAILVGIAGVARHDVGIDIDRVDGIHDGDPVVVTKDVEDVAAVALGAVGDKDLVIRHLEPAVAVVVLGDRGTEELIPLLRPVAVEASVRSHLVDRGMHRLAHGGGERLGDIADAAADHAGGGFGIRLGEGLHASRDFGKEVAGLELEIVGVKGRHRSAKLSEKTPREARGKNGPLFSQSTEKAEEFARRRGGAEERREEKN